MRDKPSSLTEFVPHVRPGEKSRVEQLAIFGGKPAYDEPLHVGCPNLPDRDHLLLRVNDLLDRKWLTNNGTFVREFEQSVAEFVGTKYCVATCNGTLALQLAIRALGLTGQVIVPSMTFIATAHALQWQHVTPVFCDIAAKSHTIDPGRVEELITPRTTGILGVHLWGRPCEIEALTEIAHRHDLALIFDAAHAFGCGYKGHMVGAFGAAEVFSFHATKFFNTFEGGAVVTNDGELASRIRRMKNFGFDGDDVTCIGINGKMSEVAAAMGLSSLASLDEFWNVNKWNYHTYSTQLESLPGLNIVSYDENQANNYQYIVIEVDQSATGLSRDQLLQVLRAENILARRYFYPGCHRLEPYRSQNHNIRPVLPVTEAVLDRVLVLPTGTAIAPEDIIEIVGLLRLALDQPARVLRRLAGIQGSEPG